MSTPPLRDSYDDEGCGYGELSPRVLLPSYFDYDDIGRRPGVAAVIDPPPPASPPACLTPYVALGLPLVFWPRLPDPDNDWKGPRDKHWPHKIYDPADYRDGMQVGVKLGVEIAPGRWLVDMDLDWAPGISFFPRFLSDTGFGFGRASKPVGHAFYTTSFPVAFYKFKDVDGTNLGERRGTKTDGTVGLQTVLPPSVHRESGEVLTLMVADSINRAAGAREARRLARAAHEERTGCAWAAPGSARGAAAIHA